ncbi:hypothetical protein LP414_19665 [Polaromonas sp. P1(28)-13]|nr:hypothetical protein LP414_19665 [Polaromonas sp. P1(28)-13]
MPTQVDSAISSARGVLVEVEHTGLDHVLLLFAQGIHLRLHDLRVSGHAEVVIAIQPDGVGARRFAMQHEFATPLLIPSRGEIPGDALGQLVSKRRVASGPGGGGKLAFKYLHGEAPLLMEPLLKALKQIDTGHPLSELTGIRVKMRFRKP